MDWALTAVLVNLFIRQQARKTNNSKYFLIISLKSHFYKLNPHLAIAAQCFTVHAGHAPCYGSAVSFTYVELHKRKKALIPNQHSSHLHEDIQQLDAAAQEGRHRFVSHPDILHTNSPIFTFMEMLSIRILSVNEYIYR